MKVIPILTLVVALLFGATRPIYTVLHSSTDDKARSHASSETTTDSTSLKSQVLENVIQLHGESNTGIILQDGEQSASLVSFHSISKNTVKINGEKLGKH